jgi:hypothetical protein
MFLKVDVPLHDLIDKGIIKPGPRWPKAFPFKDCNAWILVALSDEKLRIKPRDASAKPTDFVGDPMRLWRSYCQFYCVNPSRGEPSQGVKLHTEFNIAEDQKITCRPPRRNRKRKS